MKVLLEIVSLILFTAHLGAAEVLAQKGPTLLLSGGPDAAAGAAAVNELKTDLGSQGGAVTEVSIDEVEDVGQAAALNNGGPVVAIENKAGKASLKVYDGVSGSDITEVFKAGLRLEVKAAPKPEPAPVVEVQPAPTEPPKPVEKAVAGEKSVFPRNHIGLSLGMASLAKNKDSLEMLQQGNPGSQIKFESTGRVQLFYERGLSTKYTLGLAAELEKGGDVKYDGPGLIFSIIPKRASGSVYVLRNFGKHFGLFLGGGADAISLYVNESYLNMPGNTSHPAFTSEMLAAHAEAGVALSAGNFSLRFSLRKILPTSGELTTTANGSKYRLIVKNGNALSYKAEGQSLAANEQYYKADFGGTAAAVALTYSFANW